MLDIPNIYGDPIIYDRRRGTAISPYKNKKETVFIETNYAILSEVPNKYDKVKVTGLGLNWYETEDEEFLEENLYWVDYTHGHVYFHGKHTRKTVNIEYTGEGVRLFPDSRIYHTSDPNFPTVKDKFIDVDRAIEVERNRISEQIISHPQPSEVVDQRVDYNGKVFKVAKDRIDAEQKKIEEAYFDARGKRFDSLKLRIDSLQLATEEKIEDQEKENVSIWASIDLIPGQITLETGKLEEKINGTTTLLQSQIDMIPEKIELSVKKLEEDVDGKLSSSESNIKMLSDQIKLKVDVDGVTSAINLSKEGVRIDGKKIWINGETKIDSASIKSAHIESLDANKITAGAIDTSRISIHGGSSTEYLNLKGNTLESRGQVTTTWFGETSTRDVLFQIQNGYFRVRNNKENKSIYFYDYGISSFHQGYAPDAEDYKYYGSGVIDFHSHMYNKDARGLTLFSNRGILAMKTEYRGIILDSASYIELRAKGEIRFKGSVRSSSIGVVDSNTNFYVGVDSEMRVTNKKFYNSGNTTYRDIRARDYRGRRFIDTGGTSYIYMGSNLGVRITSKGTNKNDNIIYRPIQASAFQVRSSKNSKKNIKKTVQKGLDAIRQLNIVDFNYKGSDEVSTGFIAEESSAISSEDSEFIDLNKTVALLTLAVQELDKKLSQKNKG